MISKTLVQTVHWSFYDFFETFYDFFKTVDLLSSLLSDLLLSVLLLFWFSEIGNQCWLADESALLMPFVWHECLFHFWWLFNFILYSYSVYFLFREETQPLLFSFIIQSQLMSCSGKRLGLFLFSAVKKKYCAKEGEWCGWYCFFQRKAFFSSANLSENLVSYI